MNDTENQSTGSLTMHLVIATLTEPGYPDDPDHEVFGPFSTGKIASDWADRFETWFDRQGGDRQIVRLLVTQTQNPSFVEIPEPVDIFHLARQRARQRHPAGKGKRR